jgi:hypothetical protein
VLPGTQDPVHVPPLQTYAHAAPFTHCPLEPQVWGVVPMHCAGEDPGVQREPHAPAVIEPFTHAPALLHVCGVAPLHLVEPGEQTPVQEPALHTLGQTALDTHWPLVPQVCGVFIRHCVWPGAHWPAHEADKGPPSPRLAQVELVHGTGVPQTPDSHACTPLPEHCVSPGEHEPWHAPALHVESLHGTGASHAPAAEQVWTSLATHCVCPGEHPPVQAPFTQACSAMQTTVSRHADSVPSA